MQKPRREATSSTNLATNLFKEAKNEINEMKKKDFLLCG